MGVFERGDILCTPASLDAAFDAQLRYPTEQVGKQFANYLGWMMPPSIVTVLQCPALVMPCGFLDDGRPVGVQIVGAPGKDATVLNAAAELEAALSLCHRCPEPRSGSSVLGTVGPRSATEAEAHHAQQGVGRGRFRAEFHNDGT